MAYDFFIVLIVIASLLMIGVVLIQESKGGGLSSQFSSSNSIMGVRKTTDVVEKLTWGLAIALVVISVACAYVTPNTTTDQSVMEQSATQNQATNPTNTQGFGASQQQGTGNGAQNNAATPAAGGQGTMPVAPKGPAK